MSVQIQQHRKSNPPLRLRARALSIPPEEATFEKRGFHASTPQIRNHLETVGQTFLFGYHAALVDPPVDDLADHLRQTDHDFQGFAFEGAAMGLSLLDRFSLGRSRARLPLFIHGPGQPHIYMVHVGVGWMLARIPWGMRRAVARLDPLLGWLAVDGFGFHEAFFHYRRYAGGRKLPRISRGYWLRAFDQGFGRCLWFVMGASTAKIADAIEAFPEPRRADLWSGIGLAATYAGGVNEDNLLAIRSAAGAYSAAPRPGRRVRRQGPPPRRKSHRAYARRQ